jgi:hypothetical protein
MPFWRPTVAVLQRDENPDEEFAKILLREGREELGRADGKASALLGAAGIVAAALLAGAIAGDWNPTKLHHDAARNVLWASIAIAGVGHVFLAAAVMPRTRNLGDRERLAYFGDVVGFREKGIAIRMTTRRAKEDRGRAEFRTAVGRVSGSRLNRTLDQVWVVSAIVHRKYRCIRAAMWLFAVAIGGAAASLMVNAVRLP